MSLFCLTSAALALSACANVRKDEIVTKAEVACLDKLVGDERDDCVDRYLADRNFVASRSQQEYAERQRAREDRYARGDALGVPKRDRASLPIPPSSTGPGVPPGRRAPN